MNKSSALTSIAPVSIAVAGALLSNLAEASVINIGYKNADHGTSYMQFQAGAKSFSATTNLFASFEYDSSQVTLSYTSDGHYGTVTHIFFHASTPKGSTVSDNTVSTTVTPNAPALPTPAPAPRETTYDSSPLTGVPQTNYELSPQENVSADSVGAGTGEDRGSGRETPPGGFVGSIVPINPGSIGVVPLPASAPLFGAALAVLGLAGFGLRRRGSPLSL